MLGQWVLLFIYFALFLKNPVKGKICLMEATIFCPPQKAFIHIFVTISSLYYGRLPCPLLTDHAALVK